MADVYIAKTSAVVLVDGEQARIQKGITRVQEGHKLLKDHPDFFQPADEGVRFSVEDARQTPAKTAAAKKAAASKPAGETKKAETKAEDKPESQTPAKTAAANGGTPAPAEDKKA